ncbi:uncharacterized protein LOC143037191 [Oratosquilla oratoria]|uniref:uncharacterized protein LOC143037191 n=1 Tax=Oratosquilla oratoria TaxID=337810 RepID=UPI003F7644BC
MTSGQTSWESIGVDKANDNGYRLLVLCSEHQLHNTNTNFQLKTKHKNTWKHYQSGHCSTSATTCATHKKLNIASLGDPEVCAQFRCNVAESLMQHDQGHDLGTKWTRLHSDLCKCAVNSLGFKRKYYQDWFDQNSSRIYQLLEEKMKVHYAHLNNPQSIALKNRFTNIRAEVQRELRQMENKWWQARTTELQHYADSNNSHGFYNAVKTIYGPKRHSNHLVRAADGVTLLKSNEQIKSRWAEHFNTLLNQVNPIIPIIFDSLPNLPTMVSLDNPPEMGKILRAISELKDNKSPGPDRIPSELFKQGGYLLKVNLHKLISEVWTNGEVPHILKDANIFALHKKKGYRANCCNRRGISLLVVAGKIVAKIMLSRLMDRIMETKLPESQCGFHKDHSSTGTAFCLRQLQEKARKKINIFLSPSLILRRFSTQ